MSTCLLHSKMESAYSRGVAAAAHASTSALPCSPMRQAMSHRPMCLRRAMYNIGKKTVKAFQSELAVGASMMDKPPHPRHGAIVADYPAAAEHMEGLAALLPRTAKLHESQIYNVLLNTQIACMTQRRDIEEAFDLEAGALDFQGA